MWDICLCALVLLSPTMSLPRGRETSSAYQITERIDDIPDNRTLAPIDPTYGIQVPLNFGNNTVQNSVDTTTEHVPITNPYEVPEGPVTENKPASGTYEVNENKPATGTYQVSENKPATGTYQVSENKPATGTYQVSENKPATGTHEVSENKPFEKPGQSNNQENKTGKTNNKKTSFSILHIKGEFDSNDKGTSSNAGSNTNAGFKGFLDGLRSYLYSMKKGVVDGLYNWYQKDQAKNEINKFYRSFNKDDVDDSTADDDVRNWIHRDEVQKEINDFYKTFNEDSREESDSGGPDGGKKVPGVPKVNEGEPAFPVPDVETIPGDDEFKPSGPDYGEESDDEENETDNDEIDVRYGEQHSSEYDHYDDYDHHHHHHRRHRKFGDCK